MSENLRNAMKSREEQVEETLEYLSDKYSGQKFVYQSSKKLYGKLIIYCYPEGGTYKTEPVRVRRDIVDGKVQYLDTYFNVVMREDAEAEVVSVCSDLGLKGRAFFHVDDSYLNNQFDGSKNYADYMKWDLEDGEMEHSRSYTLVIARDGITDYASYVGQIVDAMKAKDIICDLGVFFCTDEQYEYYNRENLGELRDLEPEARFYEVTGQGE